MKKMTKIVAVLLSVVMLFCVASVNCFAAEAKDLDVSIPEFDFFNPDKVASKSAKANKAPAASKAASGSITIDEDVDFAEYAGSNITSVTIEDGCEYIDSLAFANCDSLKTIKINTPDCYFDFSIAWGCDNLEKIIICDEHEEFASDSKGIVYDKGMTGIYYAPAKSVGTSYVMPSTVETMLPWAFMDCYDYSLTLSKNFYFDEDPELLNEMFLWVGANEFKVNSQNPNYKVVDGVLYSKDGGILIKYPIADGEREFYSIPDSVYYICENAFYQSNIIMAELYAENDLLDLFAQDYWLLGKKAWWLTVHVSENTLNNLESGIGMGVGMYCIEGISEEEAQELTNEGQLLLELAMEELAGMLDDLDPYSPEYKLLDDTYANLLDYIPCFGTCEEVHSEIVDYAIIDYPNKYTYTYKTENLDLDGLTVMLTCLDGSKSLANVVNWDDDEIKVTGFDNTQTGVQVVTVESDYFTVEFEVEVAYSWWQWLIVIFLFGWIWY